MACSGSRRPASRSSCSASAIPPGRGPARKGEGIQRGFRSGAQEYGNTAIDSAQFGLAAFLLATCRSGAASGVLPRKLVGAGVAAAGLLIVSAAALFIDHGPFQFCGPVDLRGGIPAVL